MATTLSDADIYKLARQAGFSGPDATTMTAIALAESGGRPADVGDVNLTTPGEKSVGLWQINYRPSRDANNPVRDPQANLDPLTNAKNAYLVSGKGKTFKPWSTYTNGAYRKFFPRALQASAAAASSGPGFVDTLGNEVSGAAGSIGGAVSDAAGAVGGAISGVFGGATSAVGGAVSDATSGVLGSLGNSLKEVALLGLFAAAGVALVVAGVWRSTGKPSIVPVPV